MNEFELQEKFVSLLKESNSFKYILKEVPYKYKKIDVVAITQREEIITIELKLNNWQRLLNQASVNLVFSDYSYIAIPSKQKNKIINRLYHKVELLSLGLIVIDNKSYKIIRKPPKNNYKIKKYYNIFRDNIIRCLNGI